jgi:hypothetical protein
MPEPHADYEAHDPRCECRGRGWFEEHYCDEDCDYDCVGCYKRLVACPYNGKEQTMPEPTNADYAVPAMAPKEVERIQANEGPFDLPAAETDGANCTYACVASECPHPWKCNGRAFTDFDIPQQPQRQDALDHQIQTVYGAAVRLGCYDAADWINRFHNGSKEAS